jgi:hypothetical protein
MVDPNPQVAKHMIIETIRNQIRDNDPPETKQTLERLIAEGIPEEEAMNLIGCVISTEIFEILKNQRSFNLERYIKTLKRLPQLPWD